MQPNKIDILDVATYLIQHQNRNDYAPFKIQNLAFWVYSKYLIDFNYPMFNNDFQSWPYGAVSLKLYNTLSREKTPLNPHHKIKKNYDENIFTQQEKEIMDYIIKKYGSKTRNAIATIIQKPYSIWCRCYISQYFALNNIPDKLIQNYYSRQNRKV
ncbi:Panacea domain-containing protein [Candidatus Phytoplasma australiense]|nr:Panacea domain-containing protein [Candidatus Phytoplasma australiense]